MLRKVCYKGETMSKQAFFKRTAATDSQFFDQIAVNAYRNTMMDDKVGVSLFAMPNRSDYALAGYQKLTAANDSLSVGEMTGNRRPTTQLFSKNYQQLPNERAKKSLSEKLQSVTEDDKLKTALAENRLKNNRKWLGLVFAAWFVIAIFYLVSSIYSS